VIIIDDMIDTAGTLTEAASAVIEHGAKSVIAAATHGVLSGPALERIINSKLGEVIITDTINASKEVLNNGKIKVLSTANLFAESIQRIYKRESISSLFNL
jgi:ribose-phosphate pyrophosphokinase